MSLNVIQFFTFFQDFEELAPCCRFWSKFLIERNSVGNIFKPNILQTLLGGRKKRHVELYGMLQLSQLLSSIIFYSDTQSLSCSNQWEHCLKNITTEQEMTRRISTKYRLQDTMQYDELTNCKKQYKACLEK